MRSVAIVSRDETERLENGVARGEWSEEERLALLASSFSFARKRK